MADVEQYAGCIECGFTAKNPGDRCGGCGAPLVVDAIKTATHGQVVQVLHDEEGADLFVFPRKGRPYALRLTEPEAHEIGLLLLRRPRGT